MASSPICIFFTTKPPQPSWQSDDKEKASGVGSVLKTGKIFCARTRRLLPTPPPFPPPPLPVRPAEQSPNVTAASWDYTGRIGQSESMLWSRGRGPTNGRGAGRVR